ncbi:hypothetical protein ACJMK2_034558 [Sinanodonta woodiana]|uniref:ADP-ribosylhydrolase ARH1 n=1 Tax=Sinanodonta woodiana TaxID=1069815 RepID=A0ABD3WSH6_SINWO
MLKTDDIDKLKERFEACMVLSGVGDALGFRNGCWEFCYSGRQIHYELEDLGGIENISVQSLVECDDTTDKENLYRSLARHYVECMKDMNGRAPGETCLTSCRKLRPHKQHGYLIPFNEQGGGCGAAMRAMCIGLRFPRPQDLEDLIAVSVEAGRMTHHHPTGYLGSLAAALFTSYAIQGCPVRQWGKGLMDCLPKALMYVQSQGRYVEENERTWNYFKGQWARYLAERHISDGKSDPVFPDKYGIDERDQIYDSWSFAGWGGSSGHDAPMIAYDALLFAGNNWKELCHRAMFHHGASGSTGVMAGAWFGSMFGYNGVPDVNYKNLEYLHYLKKAGAELYRL